MKLFQSKETRAAYLAVAAEDLQLRIAAADADELRSRIETVEAENEVMRQLLGDAEAAVADYDRVVGIVALQRERMKTMAAEALALRSRIGAVVQQRQGMQVALTALTMKNRRRWNNPAHIPADVDAVNDGDGCLFVRVTGGWSAPTGDVTNVPSSIWPTLRPEWAPYYEAPQVIETAEGDLFAGADR